jgi:hypothetical protein
VAASTFAILVSANAFKDSLVMELAMRSRANDVLGFDRAGTTATKCSGACAAILVVDSGKIFINTPAWTFEKNARPMSPIQRT